MAVVARPTSKSPPVRRVPEASALWVAARPAPEKVRRQRFRDEILPEDKAEFIAGEIIMHSPALPRHNRVVNRLLSLWFPATNYGQLGEIVVEKGLCAVGPHDFEPDLAYFAPDRQSLIDEATGLYPAPTVAVEVLSPSTAERDRGIKFREYAQHGTGEYWLIDPAKATFEQYVAQQGVFAPVVRAEPAWVVCHCLPTLRFPVACLFSDAALAAHLQKSANAAAP